jgi:hypothetical protein
MWKIINKKKVLTSPLKLKFEKWIKKYNFRVYQTSKYSRIESVLRMYEKPKELSTW